MSKLSIKKPIRKKLSAMALRFPKEVHYKTSSREPMDVPRVTIHVNHYRRLKRALQRHDSEGITFYIKRHKLEDHISNLFAQH